MADPKRNIMGGGVAAILVVVCMLLCSFSPAIVTWNEEFVYADDGEDGVDLKNYVSIGDSTVNGYGMEGYYKNERGENYSGYLQDVEGAYPYKVLGSLGEGWDLVQLATSAMRMDDLALMLGNDVETREYLAVNDYYFNRVGDMHDAIRDSVEFQGHCDCTNSLDRKTVLECVQSHYQSVVSDADLISIGLGMNNFGTYLTMSIDRFIKTGTPPFDSEYYRMDFTGYPGITSEMVTYAENLMDDLIELLKSEMGITGSEPIPGTPLDADTVIRFIEFLARALVYEYIGFIVYFDWSIERIFEINDNPDLNIVVVDLYRSLDGFTCTFGGMDIPLATIHNLIIDSANVYTKDISRWAYDSRVLHADLEGTPDILIDDIRSTADSDTNSAGYTAAQSSLLIGLLNSFGLIDDAKALVPGVEAYDANCTVGLRQHYEFVDRLYSVIEGYTSAFETPLKENYLPLKILNQDLLSELIKCETIDQIREIDVRVFAECDEYLTKDILSGIKKAHEVANDDLGKKVFIKLRLIATEQFPTHICEDVDFIDEVFLCLDEVTLKSLVYPIFSSLNEEILEGILAQILQIAPMYPLKGLIDTLGDNFDSYADATEIELSSIFNISLDSLNEPGTMRLFIQTLLSNGVYQHPSGSGYDTIRDAIIDAYHNKNTEKDFPFSIYDDYLKNGGFDGLVSDLETYLEDLRGYLEQLRNSPQYVGLQAKFDAFTVDCNDLLVAIGSGDIDAICDAIEDVRMSYSELRAYTLALATEFFDMEKYSTFISEVEEVLSDIFGYIDIVTQYVQAAMDSVDWEAVGPIIEDIADRLLAEFEGSPFYDVLVEKFTEIETVLEERFDELMIALGGELESFFDAVMEFNKAVEAAIVWLEQFLIDLGNDVGAEIRAAIEMAIAAYDALLAMVEEFIDHVENQLDVAFDMIVDFIKSAIVIVKDLQNKVAEIIESIDAYVNGLIVEIEDIILVVTDAINVVGSVVIAIPAYMQQGMGLDDAMIAADIPGAVDELKVIIGEIDREIQDLDVFIGKDLTEMLKLRIDVIDSFLDLVKVTVLDKLTYEEQDKTYFYNGFNPYPLYIGGAVDDDSKYGDLLGLRLMDIVELMGGTESDGLVRIYDGVDKDALYTDIAESGLVVIETDSGNTGFILNDLVLKVISEQYPAFAPASLDFSRYDVLLGVSATEWLNNFEENVAPLMEEIALLYPGNDKIIDLLEFLVERVTYTYLGAFSAMVESEMIVHAVNPYATILFTSAYNPFEGMHIDLDEVIIPIGEVFGALTTVFNLIVSEYCEDTERVVFVDLHDVDTKVSSYGAIDFEILYEFLLSGFGILEPTVAGYQQIESCVDSVIDGLECIQTHYFISFVDEDGTVLQRTLVEYGARPVYMGEIPEKDADDQYSYTFVGWDPEIMDVTCEATYTAVYESTINQYTITWVNYDGTELDTDIVAYGDIPEYVGATPTKAATAEYTYAFVGWDPNVVAVTGDAIYTATYSASANEYTVTWMVDGIETEVIYEYGDDIVKPQDPVKIGYTFAGWDGTIPATMPAEDLVFTATWTINEYTVTWMVDGIETEIVYEYGNDIVKPQDPVKIGYTFAGWDGTIPATMPAEDLVFTATWTINEYTVTWMVDGIETKTIHEYGVVPEFDGTPTKAATAQYTYTFAGWDPEVVAVTGDAVYTAVFESTVNQYTVTWINHDGLELDTDQVAYGSIPVYSGIAPTKAATAQYTYTFAGWDPEVVAVTGDAVYTATFYVNLVIFTADDDEARFVVDDVPETADNIVIRADTWEITLPEILLVGLPAGAEVSLSVNTLTVGEVPGFVQPFAGDMEVIVLGMAINGNVLSDFGTEKVTVSLNFVPRVGMDTSNISMYYLDESSMTLEEHPAVYDAENSLIVFETSHFSYWFVGEGSATTDNEGSSHEIHVAILILILVILALCGAIMKLEK